MPNRSSNRGKGKKPFDANKFAFSVVQQATEQAENLEVPTKLEKNPAAVTLGRLGGLKGGKARAEALSPKKRSEIAKKAAKKRWAKEAPSS